MLKTEKALCIKNEQSEDPFFWETFALLPHNPYLLNNNIGSLKCLLVFLIRKTNIYSGDYPIALGYMASILRMNGAEADILIQDIESYDADTFLGYDLISFYPMVALLNETLRYAETVKNGSPSAKICFFNSEQHQHEMLFCSPKALEIAMHVMEQCRSIDFILVGEAEYSFLKLCEKIASGKNSFSDIPSCVYRDNGRIIATIEPIRPADFRYLPYPSRDFLERTISSGNINSFSPRIQSSRGCLGRCLYCAESSSNITSGGRREPWIGRDIVRFVDEIEYLSKNYGVVFFNVIDSSFEDPGPEGLDRMRMFCREIDERGLEASFKIHLRFETVSKLSNELILMLKHAGVDVLILGAESGIENELRSYRKRTTAQKTIDNCHRLESFGKFFQLLGHMMFSPFLKIDDLPLKMEFLRKLGHGWDYMNVSNNILVFQGTAYHDLIREKGLDITNNDLTGTVSYRFEDERVRRVAEEMGDLKIKCPEVICLNNLIYDALNIKARYHNKMNRHLWCEGREFTKYTEGLQSRLDDIEDVFSHYFLDIVSLAGTGWDASEAGHIYEKWVAEFIPAAARSMEELINAFLDKLQRKGLSVDKLYLKTWMSVINTQINTASGKIK